MQSWKLRVRQKPKLVGLLCLALIALVVSVVIYKARTASSLSHVYRTQLEVLETSLGQLPQQLEVAQDLKLELDDYTNYLGSLSKPCKIMLQKKLQAAKKNHPEASSKRVAEVERLCTDLTAVATYSRSLYYAVDTYLLADTASVPDISNPVFGEHLARLGYIIRYTKEPLLKLDNSQVEDPALPELLSQVEATEKLVNQATEAYSKKDNVMAQALTAQLLTELNKDKLEFLQARSYFWNNTVQLDALQQAVSKLRSAFET